MCICELRTRELSQMKNNSTVHFTIYSSRQIRGEIYRGKCALYWRSVINSLTFWLHHFPLSHGSWNERNGLWNSSDLLYHCQCQHANAHEYIYMFDKMRFSNACKSFHRPQYPVQIHKKFAEERERGGDSER